MAYSKCVRCNNCDGFPCLVHAKSDAEVIAVRPAIEHPNVTLLRGARAVRLHTNDAGTAVTEVEVERDGAAERYAADLVVVSAGAANSAALLLASANERHPNGLANGSDMVGRHYMFHNSVAVLALSKEPNPTVFQKTLGVNDYYFKGPDFDYPLGNIQMVGKSRAPMYRGEKPLDTLLAPTRTLEDIGRHAVDFWLSTEDLPVAENRVTLTDDGTIKLSYTATNVEARKRLYEALKSMLGKLGMEEHHALHHAYLQEPDPGRRSRAPVGHLPLRQRPGRLGARRRLQGARARQPVRRRHELLPEHRRREPGAHGDGERAACRGPPARASRRRRRRARCAEWLSSPPPGAGAS